MNQPKPIQGDIIQATIDSPLSDGAVALLWWANNLPQGAPITHERIAKRFRWGKEKASKVIKEVSGAGFFDLIYTYDGGSIRDIHYELASERKPPTGRVYRAMRKNGGIGIARQVRG